MTMTAQMKQIVCTEPNQFVMEQGDIPVPKAGEALLRILRIGICGTDLHAYRGNQPYFTYPRILGHELSGEIVGFGGKETGGLSRGDLVSVIPYLHCGSCIACRSGRTNCCVQMSVIGVHEDGGMREYMTVPVAHLAKADGLTPDQAAIVECFSIGAHSVKRADVRPGEYVLVIGAGPIGLGVMQFAKRAGAKVIAMDINEERLQYCRTWAKADYLVNALQKPAETLEKITGGDYPTAVLDATGNVKSMEQALHYTAHGGRLVYVGLVKADLTFHDPEFHKRELTMLSSRNAVRADFEEVMKAIRDGDIDTDAFITHRSGMEHMISAYDSWLNPQTGVIKAVVEVGESMAY